MTKKLMADAKMATSIKMLKVAMGPKSTVIGNPSMPSSGMVVLSIRLIPTGAFSQSLASGLWPCSRTHGVCARNQISSGTSLPPEGCTVCAIPWAQAPPLARTERARYTAATAAVTSQPLRRPPRAWRGPLSDDATAPSGWTSVTSRTGGRETTTRKPSALERKVAAAVARLRGATGLWRAPAAVATATSPRRRDVAGTTES